jgi:hypothetical protein
MSSTVEIFTLSFFTSSTIFSSSPNASFSAFSSLHGPSGCEFDRAAGGTWARCRTSPFSSERHFQWSHDNATLPWLAPPEPSGL